MNAVMRIRNWFCFVVVNDTRIRFEGANDKN
jgi:hypothetical protein